MKDKFFFFMEHFCFAMVGLFQIPAWAAYLPLRFFDDLSYYFHNRRMIARWYEAGKVSARDGNKEWRREVLTSSTIYPRYRDAFAKGWSVEENRRAERSER